MSKFFKYEKQRGWNPQVLDVCCIYEKTGEHLTSNFTYAGQLDGWIFGTINQEPAHFKQENIHVRPQGHHDKFKSMKRLIDTCANSDQAAFEIIEAQERAAQDFKTWTVNFKGGDES